MSFDKEKENGTINSNFYLHQMYNPGNTPYNTSPASSPSFALYSNGNSFGNRLNTTAAASPGTPHLARQLNYAQASRTSSSPHHHARTAAAIARNAPTAVTITDPNDPKKLFKAAAQKEQDSWTSLDMGGMGLKNVSPTLCKYDFLTALYINHNNLTFLMPALSQLKNLKILDASGNKLNMLPPELGLLHNLRELLLFDNNLVSIPSEFGSLYQLETLGLEGNPLQSDLKNILIKDGTQALIMSLRENAPGKCNEKFRGSCVHSLSLVGMPPPHREWLLVEGDTVDDPGMT